MANGKIILHGKIELLSPALIGSGKDDKSDFDLLRDSEGKVYIPATSFVGVLRHFIKLDKSYDKDKLELFWGTSGEEGDTENSRQSSIKIEDLLPEGEPSASIRDGVKIDNKKGIAEEGAKFDYEVIESGAKFNLNIEVTLNSREDDFKKRMLATIIELLKNGKIRIGAKTTSGFGKIRLADYKVHVFDFRKKADLLRWIKEDFTEPSEFNAESFELPLKTFTISADFIIKNSLIIRSYNYDPNMPDIEHIKSKGKPVLPGTSIKGSIRARAEKIINTLKIPQGLITDLFGQVDETKKEAKKGRITIEETLIEGYPEEVQTRIKIDRFTGGVMEGALLETKPLFRGKDEKIFNLTITIQDYRDEEAGLMLLILKDLWTGDLPIGGEKAIGRGVLEGKKAVISWDKEEIEFTNHSELQKEKKEKLQSLVSALVAKKEGVV